MFFFKKKCIFTAVVFFAVSSVLCAKNFSFSVIPYFAIETSVIEEAYYYEDYSKYADRMCSLLEWEEKPSFAFGLESIFNLNKFVFSLDFSAFALILFFNLRKQLCSLKKIKEGAGSVYILLYNE